MKWLVVALAVLVALPAWARNQVWNQATWVVSAGSGSDTHVYTQAIAFMNGGASACNVAVVAPDMGGSPVTITNVQSGQIVPIAVTQVMATNTTCTAVFVLGTTGN